MQFFWSILKMKRKKDKNDLTFRSRDFEPHIFSNYPAHDFMETEGDEIKSWQGS